MNAELDRLRDAVRRLDARCRRLSDKLNEIAEFAEERHDTVDGPNGEPRPNDWMTLSNILERP